MASVCLFAANLTAINCHHHLHSEILSVEGTIIITALFVASLEGNIS